MLLQTHAEVFLGGFKSNRDDNEDQLSWTKEASEELP